MIFDIFCKTKRGCPGRENTQNRWIAALDDIFADEIMRLKALYPNFLNNKTPNSLLNPSNSGISSNGEGGI